MLRTIHEAAAAIHAGRLSSRELVEDCLARIDRYESRVRAWVLIDRAGALEQARRADDEIHRGGPRGPLHGIPIGVKDIFDVVNWPTAAGYPPWSRSIARRDSTAVRRLRQAGAIILGKTVTTQFASFDPPPTRNPWNLERTPGGSSSGSAAAVACGMCLGALASQTGGSITRPASFCGVASCKPSFGRVSLDGVVPLASSMDHVGVMAGCVRDLAILLQCIAGWDPDDPQSSRRYLPNYTARLENVTPPDEIQRFRGMFDDLAEPVMRQLMDQVCERIRSRGVAVADLALPAAFAEVIPRHRTVMAVEAASWHEPRLRAGAPEYLPNIRALLREGEECSAVEYAACKKHQEELAQTMGGSQPALLVGVCPATRGPAPSRETTGDPVFNSPWSYTGLPTVSIPASRDPAGMPLAIQLVGRSGWEEAELLAAAAWCEELFAWERREPD